MISICESGDLRKFKKLLVDNANIDISAYNEAPFRWACKNGNLGIAKWLFKVKPSIDISAYNEYAFRCACEKGHLDVAKWLKTLCPEKYHIETLNNIIVKYWVNKQLKNKIIMKKKEIVNCSICYEKQSDIQTICKHFYCEDCITTWLCKSNTCPCCRKEVNNDSLYMIEINSTKVKSVNPNRRSDRFIITHRRATK